jgi:hypothetical protein
MTEPKKQLSKIPTPKMKIEEVRKPYISPKLESLGDIRSLTLGASWGNNIETDTGNGYIRVYIAP